MIPMIRRERKHEQLPRIVTRVAYGVSFVDLYVLGLHLAGYTCQTVSICPSAPGGRFCSGAGAESPIRGSSFPELPKAIS